jgi:nucleoside-diphosphate-sugar epimerase
MRILVIGAEGTVGKAAVNELGRRHDIVKAGRSSGDLCVGLAYAKSVEGALTGEVICVG